MRIHSPQAVVQLFFVTFIACSLAPATYTVYWPCQIGKWPWQLSTPARKVPASIHDVPFWPELKVGNFGSSIFDQKGLGSQVCMRCLKSFDLSYETWSMTWRAKHEHSRCLFISLSFCLSHYLCFLVSLPIFYCHPMFSSLLQILTTVSVTCRRLFLVLPICLYFGEQYRKCSCTVRQSELFRLTCVQNQFCIPWFQIHVQPFYDMFHPDALGTLRTRVQLILEIHSDGYDPITTSEPYLYSFLLHFLRKRSA